MDFRQTITDHLQESLTVKQKVLSQCVEAIEAAARCWVEGLQAGGKILFCGNGGSAADAQHMAAELVVRLRHHFNRRPLAGLALTVDSSILTAGGNDLGFEAVFARQVEALGGPGDVLTAISTSGNSANVIRAVESARAKGLKTVGLLGGNGGQLVHLVDVPIVVPSLVTAHIQECHITIGHILCQLAEEALCR